MKLLSKSKDGGPESNVTGYFLVEMKSLFSIVLLRFDAGSREAFHDHAFNAVSWVLSGLLREEVLDSNAPEYLSPSILPVYTKKLRFHRVFGLHKHTWVISFRGPWDRYWREYSPTTGAYTTLTNGRKIVNEKSSNYR